MTNLFPFAFAWVSKYHIIYTEKYETFYLVNALSFHLNILKMHLFVFVGFSAIAQLLEKQMGEKRQWWHFGVIPLNFILVIIVRISTHK